MTLDAQLIEDRGHCMIDQRALLTLPTRNGQNIHAAVQRYILERLREAGLPILHSAGEGIDPYDEHTLWVIIQSAVKVIGCTKITAACHPHEQVIIFRWR